MIIVLISKKSNSVRKISAHSMDYHFIVVTLLVISEEKVLMTEVFRETFTFQFSDEIFGSAMEKIAP